MSIFYGLNVTWPTTGCVLALDLQLVVLLRKVVVLLSFMVSLGHESLGWGLEATVFFLFCLPWLYGSLKYVQAPLTRFFMHNGLYISWIHEEHGPFSLKELLFRYLLAKMRKKINKLCNWTSTALPVSSQITIWWLFINYKSLFNSLGLFITSS